RDFHVTGVQTCALPISPLSLGHFRTTFRARRHPTLAVWINTNLEAPNAAHLRVAMSASSFLVSAEREFIAAKKLPKLALPRHHRSEERRVGKGCRRRCA